MIKGLNPEHAWIETTYKKKFQKVDFLNHTVWLGSTETGKSYNVSWLMERLQAAGTHKFFLLNICQQEFLEEALMLLFPNANKRDQEKIARINHEAKKRGSEKKISFNQIPMKIYTPLTPDILPNELPEIYYPFTIPVNDLNEETMQALYADKDTSRIYPYYASHIKQAINNKKISYPQVKNIMRKIKRSSYFEEIGVMGLKMSNFDTKLAFKTIGGFLNRLQKFNNLGILTSAQQENNLKNDLRKEIKNQKRVCVLDLSRIKSKDIQIFCIVYFVKCLEDILEEEGEVFELPYKIACVFEESSDIFRKKSEGRKSTAQATIDMGIRLLTYGRHKKIEVWLICHTPQLIEETLFSNFKTRIVTFFENPKDIEWVAQHFKQMADKGITHTIFEAIKMQMKKGIYKFLILEEDMDNQAFIAQPMKKWGYTLPYPRTTFYQHKIPTQNGETTINRVPTYNDNEFLKKQGMPFKNIISQKYALKEEYETQENQIRTERKQEKEKRKQRIQRQITNKTLKDRIEAKKISELRQQGKGIKKIIGETGYSREKIKRLLGVWEATQETEDDILKIEPEPNPITESKPTPNTTPTI